MDKKLRIALVTGEFPPMQGGVGAFTRELAQELAQLGHEIWIITDGEARPPDVTLRRARSLQDPLPLDDYAQWLPFGKKWNWKDVAWIADCTDRYHFDLINIQYQAAAYNMNSAAINFAPWRLRHLTKTVVTFHDLRTPYLFPKAGGLREWVVRRMATSADGIIATNRQDYDQLRSVTSKSLARIPIGSNITVHNVSTADRQRTREQLGVNSFDFLLGYFGFLNESKGADTLLEALAQLDERVHLVFIGGRTGDSDPDNNSAFLQQLDAHIERLGLVDRVHWTGFVADEQVSQWMAAADLMVMPYRDGVSLRRGTLMAVLAHGRPLLTTEPQVATPELVHGENVWLVSAENTPELQGAVVQLRDHPELRTKIGAGAAALSEQFQWSKIAVQTATFYESIASRSRDSSVVPSSK
ncbi:MAG: glycosyltransferase family 4 protein [Anaerolineae bacterium]|nr:glycosyltransferase family 4 protein [Anaerolineae bacterium]